MWGVVCCWAFGVGFAPETGVWLELAELVVGVADASGLEAGVWVELPELLVPLLPCGLVAGVVGVLFPLFAEAVEFALMFAIVPGFKQSGTVPKVKSTSKGPSGI